MERAPRGEHAGKAAARKAAAMEYGQEARQLCARQVGQRRFACQCGQLREVAQVGVAGVRRPCGEVRGEPTDKLCVVISSDARVRRWNGNVRGSLWHGGATSRAR